MLLDFGVLQDWRIGEEIMIAKYPKMFKEMFGFLVALTQELPLVCTLHLCYNIGILVLLCR